MANSPAPQPLQWAEHGPFMSVACSARTGFTYVVFRVPGGPDAAYLMALYPEARTDPGFSETARIVGSMADGKRVAADRDVCEISLEAMAEYRRKEAIRAELWRTKKIYVADPK